MIKLAISFPTRLNVSALWSVFVLEGTGCSIFAAVSPVVKPTHDLFC